MTRGEEIAEQFMRRLDPLLNEQGQASRELATGYLVALIDQPRKRDRRRSKRRTDGESS